MTEMTCGIVAGCDGSPGSGDALRWAAREAEACGLPYAESVLGPARVQAELVTCPGFPDPSTRC
jgi:hypothetical protein